MAGPRIPIEVDDKTEVWSTDGSGIDESTDCSEVYWSPL